MVSFHFNLNIVIFVIVNITELVIPLEKEGKIPGNYRYIFKSKHLPLQLRSIKYERGREKGRQREVQNSLFIDRN